MLLLIVLIALVPKTVASSSSSDDKGTCTFDTDGEGTCTGFETDCGTNCAEEQHATLGTRFKVDMLKPLREGEFVYDFANVLNKETIRQLNNVSAILARNKSLTLVWMTVDELPEELSAPKKFGKAVLEQLLDKRQRDDSASIEKRKKDRSLLLAIRKAALLTLEVDKEKIHQYLGRKFKGKLRQVYVKRAARKGRKFIREAEYDEGLRRVAASIAKLAFKKHSLFETIRSMASLLIPGVAVLFFMRKGGKGKGGIMGMVFGRGLNTRGKNRVPRFMETAEMKMARIRKMRRAFGIQEDSEFPRKSPAENHDVASHVNDDDD